MFRRAVVLGARAGAVATRARAPAAPAAIRCMSAEAEVAEFNADVAEDFPKYAVWGPRVPVDVVEETYEQDVKNFYEQHWDEMVDLDMGLRTVASSLMDSMAPAAFDKVVLPHPKASLAVTEMTEKYFDKWMGGATGEQRILFPLCGGLSAEMGAFAAMGHRVVGVEYIRAAVDTLALYDILPEFQEEGWRENFLVHHSPESGALVAEGDFFAATPEELGTFDKVFERCGITSVPKARQAEYAKVLHSLMKPGATMLMETMSASGDTYNWCTPEEMEKVFKGPEWKIEALEITDVTSAVAYTNLNLTDVKVHNFLITRV